MSCNERRGKQHIELMTWYLLSFLNKHELCFDNVLCFKLHNVLFFFNLLRIRSAATRTDSVTIGSVTCC